MLDNQSNINVEKVVGFNDFNWLNISDLDYFGVEFLSCNFFGWVVGVF